MVYTNIDHSKRIHAVSVPLYDDTPWSKYFLFSGQCYIEAIGTSVGRDWTPQYSDIYFAKLEK